MKYVIKGETLDGIANAIRTKTGKTEKMFPTDFADEIASIGAGDEGGGEKPTLFAPSIELNDETSKLTITDDRNGDFAQGYNLYANDELVTVLTSKTAILNEYIEQTDSIYIKVQAVGTNFNSSEFSNTEVWVYVKVDGTAGLAYLIYDNGTYAMCTGIGDAVVTDIEVAGVYNDVPVNRINAAAFMNTNVTSVVIPDSVTSMGDNVFENCTALTSVVISKSLTKISDHTFNKCKNLPTLEIPKSVTQIGQHVFTSCFSLTSLEIPNSVTRIDSAAFYNCTGLTSLEIPNSVTKLGTYLFDSCSNLKRLDFSTHTSIPTLDGSAFNNTNSALQIKVPANLIDSWKNTTNWSAWASKIVTEFTNEL